MRNFKLDEILNIVKGSIVKGTGNPAVDYATFRPSMMRGYALFFDRYKGRWYEPKSFEEFNSPIIITENPDIFDVLENDAIVIKVDNVDDAYWNFTEYYRSLFNIPIIGVTGTCGKTTTKEMIKHILSTKGVVRSTYGSQNAGYLDIHYLIGINEKTDFGVFEMGVLYPEDLTDSCRVFKPQIRIILNIGVYHLTGCGTPEEYLKAKARMLDGIEKVDGTLILNIDDENIKKIDVSNVKNVIYFGLCEGADFRLTDIAYQESGMKFTFEYKNNKYDAFIPGLGKHNVYDALAAIASVSKVGVPIEEAISSLQSFKHVMEHLEAKAGIEGCTVLDDTWNSAPPSVEAAFEVLRNISGSRKKIALVGIMPLLGDNDYGRDQYSRIGEKAVESGVDMLIVVGNESREIGNRALELGMNKNSVYFTNDGNEAYEYIKPFLNKNTVILLKITHRQMKETSFIEFKNRLIPKN